MILKIEKTRRNGKGRSNIHSSVSQSYVDISVHQRDIRRFTFSKTKLEFESRATVRVIRQIRNRQFIPGITRIQEKNDSNLEQCTSYRNGSFRFRSRALCPARM
jgi:hypothetical protein